MTVRKVRQKRGWAFSVAVPIVKATLLAISRRTWVDGEKIPVAGGCVVALNHISHLDPLTSAHLLYDHGRLPRFLAKSGLFDVPVVAQILRGAKQIPVRRMTADAQTAFAAAVDAIEAGECVVVYPEGTITRDPDLWPMMGKSGAARIALATGCAVIPVGQWGVQEILPPYARRPDIFPRKRVTMKVGDPVDLASLQGQEHTKELLQEATERIMAAITVLVEDVRCASAPEGRFDPRASGVRAIGNPNATVRRRRLRGGSHERTTRDR